MADDQQSGGELLTLSEVSNRTGISMPTLQRYKKLYQARLPTVGKGRKQRYPVEALAVFEEIKKENIGRRGRPRKKEVEARAASGGRGRGARGKTAVAKAAPRRGRKPGRKAAAGATRGDLLTLTQVSEMTGISYPTLVRYVKLYSNRIPHEGKGRRRRFHPEAVDVFRQLRAESPRGRRKKSETAATGRGRARATAGDAALSRRVQALEKTQDRLEKQIKALIKNLQRPLTVTVQRK